MRPNPKFDGQEVAQTLKAAAPATASAAPITSKAQGPAPESEELPAPGPAHTWD